jgi:hypothetical protein
MLTIRSENKSENKNFKKNHFVESHPSAVQCIEKGGFGNPKNGMIQCRS